MNKIAFAAFSARALDEFEIKQRRQEEEYLQSRWVSWESTPGTDKICFSDVYGQIIAEASRVFIGSYELRAGTWKWAWSNDSLPEECKVTSEKIRELADITGDAIFAVDSEQQADENLCMYLSAMAVHHLNADGFCRLLNEKFQNAFYLALFHMRRCINHQ